MSGSADEAVHIGPSPCGGKLSGGREDHRRRESIPGPMRFTPVMVSSAKTPTSRKDVIGAGLIWVGPKPDSIRAMGLKDAAKERMIAAGVPVTPGYLGEDQSVERLKSEADKIGYPVLIKAVAGGGGKGMRKVDAAQQFEEMLQSCRREATASFGNGQVLLEKWITSPRHIEVQVFGDSHGNVVHLFERDCSLQRRHQKVIEEAPAPGMDEATREEICCAAIRAAKAVNYEGAGTIEFIADASEGLRADRIFFMEMNTRLQVEHPVTEEITGVDLVEWQLRVASGEPIPLKQEELSINGWAMEARLYAEDPATGFLPSIGTLEVFQLSDYDCRIETGYEAGDNVSPFYDPMIAKLVVKSDTREEAAEMLGGACACAAVWPVKTNNYFLSRLAYDPDFQAGKINTSFIAERQDRLVERTAPQRKTLAAGLKELVSPHSRRGAKSARSTMPGPQGFRLNASPRNTYSVFVDGELRQIELTHEGATFWQIVPLGSDVLVTDDDGQLHHFTFTNRKLTGHHSAHDGEIVAPMPGKVIAVDVAEGDAVTAGQRLLVLEAMKMEHALTAPFDGTVTELNVSEGGQVQVEAVLAVVEAAAES